MTNDKIEQPIGQSDFGTTERWVKQGGLYKQVADRTNSGKIISKRAVSNYPSSLHWYYKKGTITFEMLEAGTIFAQLFENAQLSAQPKSCLQNLIKVDKSRGGSVWSAEFAEDARRKVNKCYDLLSSLESDVLRSVAGYDERAAGEKRVLALKTGLRALCVYFKIPVS